MPTQANITVKKNDNVTDIIYVGLVPAGGDGIPNLYRVVSWGGVAAQRPTLTVASRWNGPKTHRRVDTEYIYYEVATDSTTGLTAAVRQVPIKVTASIPMGTPQAVIDEAISQCFNLHANTAVKDQFKAGFAAT
jgi:hypothetical protein